MIKMYYFNNIKKKFLGKYKELWLYIILTSFNQKSLSPARNGLNTSQWNVRWDNSAAAVQTVRVFAYKKASLVFVQLITTGRAANCSTGSSEYVMQFCSFNMPSATKEG
jgi:hypothetical protein